jgi:hypothetical protein
MRCIILITDGYEYFVFDKININRINWVLVGEIMLILRESWREQYEKINGNFKQLNAQDQWTMNDDPWLDPKWKFTSNIN